MAAKSKIEWTEDTWNPVTGCTPISAGCTNCYAYAMANRLKSMRCPKYADGFDVRLHLSSLDEPLKWKGPRLVFVNSMSDLFHEDVPAEFIQDVFTVMNAAQTHTFQVLTKRDERLLMLSPSIKWTPNIWQGVTVESADHTYRIDRLRKTGAAVKFVSFEPLLGDIGAIDLTAVNWAIVGGESGPRARPIALDWVLNLKNQCDSQNVAFYFKQWGGVNKSKSGRELLGRTWDDMPSILPPRR